MRIIIDCAECAAGAVMPLVPAPQSGSLAGHHLQSGQRVAMRLAVGTELAAWNENSARGAIPGPKDVLFQVVSHMWQPAQWPAPAQFAPLLMAKRSISRAAAECVATKRGYSLASITLSDKGAGGLRQDTSGPLIAQMVSEAVNINFSQHFIIADEADILRPLLTTLALQDNYNVICTTGGTGLSERDITPQTTVRVLDMELPGFSQAMMAKSLSATPNAALSRAIAGIVGKCLVINLPGSKKAVRENLEAILPALAHTLKKLNGDISDCGGE